MRIVVLHSDVGADAPPDELETLTTADAVARALRNTGHFAALAPFPASLEGVRKILDAVRADAVFNMVESVFGQDSLAAMAPSIFERLSISYTGSAAAPIALAGDKPLAKRVLRAAGLPTPDWSEPPSWDGLEGATPYIVKSATEDASLGLDDGALVRGRMALSERFRHARELHGGRWFAEAYVEGREFNVALLEDQGGLRALPIPEMCFEDWPAMKPRIVGYRAKWEEGADEAVKTVRAFGLEQQEPDLARALTDLACEAAHLFGIGGYARVDFRVDGHGRPTILEINPNPCLEPNSGFAAAARQAGFSYDAMIGSILAAAARRDPTRIYPTFPSQAAPAA
jgi:D-alanine-D-alanine ligase